LRDAGSALAICATVTATQAAARVPATRAGRAVAVEGGGAVTSEFVVMALSFESRDTTGRRSAAGAVAVA
jgi:hypothetical protein